MTIERISHRTLRNESGRVLKAVEQGETFIITNNGHDVATLCPLSDDLFPGLTVSRSDPQLSFTSLIPGDSSCAESSAEILDYLRGDR